MVFLKVVVIGLIVGVAQGASVPEKTKQECSQADAYQALSCEIRIADFQSKLKNLDHEDPAEVAEFKRTCNIIKTCLNPLTKCTEANNKEVKESIKAIKSYCGLIKFVHDEFKECDQKLKTSQCYQDWHAFLDDDDYKDSAALHAACQNFFGKDDCVKKDVTEICGEEYWIKLRDATINFNKGVMTIPCDFKKFE